jgi:hypothetical protein
MMSEHFAGMAEVWRRRKKEDIGGASDPIVILSMAADTGIMEKAYLAYAQRL